MNKEYIHIKSEAYGEHDIYLTLSNYFTYNNQIIDCECVEEMTKDSINIKTNKSFSLYENVNDKFIINDDEYVTLDEGVTLEEHIKLIIQEDSIKSEIFKLDDGIYYKLDVFETAPNTTDVWAIVNTADELYAPLEESGLSDVPHVSIKDWCGVETGEKYIRLKDINPYSLTYGKIIEQLRCDTPALEGNK